jgi:hypothetical protein
MSGQALGPTQLPVQWVPGPVYWGVKWQEYAEIKNGGAIPPLPCIS